MSLFIAFIYPIKWDYFIYFTTEMFLVVAYPSDSASMSHKYGVCLLLSLKCKKFQILQTQLTLRILDEGPWIYNQHSLKQYVYSMYNILGILLGSGEELSKKL